MNDYLKFSSAGPATRAENDDFWCANINVFGETTWLSRVQVFGDAKEETEQLRDRILWSLSCPTHPELWQYQDKDNPAFWHTTADVALVVRAKSEGCNTRGLYLKASLEQEG